MSSDSGNTILAKETVVTTLLQLSLEDLLPPPVTPNLRSRPPSSFNSRKAALDGMEVKRNRLLEQGCSQEAIQGVQNY